MTSSKRPAQSADQMPFLFPGRASDTEAGILATGVGDATAVYLGFSARSETGEDADYIRWHMFDHVPEQWRIPGVRHFNRWVSTSACRAARRAQEAPFDQADHAVQYLFGEPMLETIASFMDLGAALTTAGRQPLKLPRVQAGAYVVVDKRVNPKSTLGAYAVPWYPASGVYVTIEPTPPDKAAWAAHSEALGRLVELDGVAGAWRYSGVQRQFHVVRSDPGLTATVFYLYADPVATAGPLGDLLEKQWAASGRRALFAAPFHIVHATQWDRYLP